MTMTEFCIVSSREFYSDRLYIHSGFAGLRKVNYDCHLMIEKGRTVIGLVSIRYTIGLKNSRHFFHPIRNKTQKLARVFPRYVSVICNYFEL